MSQFSRREFVATMAAGATGMMLKPTDLAAKSISVSVEPAALLPEAMADARLQNLARHAIDAARLAGASYADIRVAERRSLIVAKQFGLDFYVSIGASFSYGVRALVNGTWASVYGTTPTPDAIAKSAGAAVTKATHLSKILSGGRTLVPAPVSTGEWSTPVSTDPFNIPLDEQMALLSTFDELTKRIPGAFGGPLSFRWIGETRVISNTEGTMVTERHLKSYPSLNVGANRMRGRTAIMLPVPNIVASSGGYETVSGASIQNCVIRSAEEAVILSLLPERPLDVGRYPAVVDGVTAGHVVYSGIGRGLEIDYVSGDEAEASGTSQFAPVKDFLDAKVVSSLINITSDRSAPSVVARRWDDEGVLVKPTVVIKDGAIVDYQTTREQANGLDDMYLKHGADHGSRGCAISDEAERPIQMRCGHLSVASAPNRVSLEDLIKDIPRGVVIRETYMLSSDQQGSSGSISMALFLEVERGKIVRRMGGNAAQFRILSLLNDVAALGGVETMRETTGRSFKGMPWTAADYHVSAPAMLCKSVDIITTGQRYDEA